MPTRPRRPRPPQTNFGQAVQAYTWGQGGPAPAVRGQNALFATPGQIANYNLGYQQAHPANAPGSGGGAAAAQPGGDPGTPPLGDDATAAAARAQALFRRNQQLASLTQQSAYDTTDFQEALRRLREQRPQVEQTTRETANRQGLFYSGQLGKRLGDVATDFTRRQGDAQQAYDRREAARVAARKAIEQGAPLEDAAITAALIDRQVGRDTTSADAGVLAPPAPEPTPTPAPVPAPRPALPRGARAVRPTRRINPARRGKPAPRRPRRR